MEHFVNPPGWRDVNAPDDVIQTIRRGSFAPGVLESLAHLLINRHIPRTIYHYHCHQCGYIHQPERASEEVSFCPACQSYKLSYSVKVTQSQPKKMPLIQRMQEDFSSLNDMLYYYTEDQSAPVTLDCGFARGGYYSHYSCGERVDGKTPRQSLIKAAVLCPFLWDFGYDWSMYFDHKCGISPAMVLAVIAGVRL